MSEHLITLRLFPEPGGHFLFNFKLDNGLVTVWDATALFAPSHMDEKQGGPKNISCSSRVRYFVLDRRWV